MANLRELSTERGCLFGCAVNLAALDNDADYRQLVARECAVIVPENNGKFGPLSPNQGVHDFAGLDRIVDFGKENGLKVRGHTLVWHTQMPTWLNDSLPVQEILEDHIVKTMSRYKGKIESWDVVNEAVSDDSGMRDTLFLRTLGPDYIKWAFNLAQQVDPECQLVYNDYSIDDVNPKSDKVYELVQDLLDKGIRIDAVGLQAHLESANPPSLDSVRQNIRRFRKLGLQVLVTEMDIRIPEPFSLERREEQAEQYEGFVRVCLEEGVSRILTWGITDRYSWVPGFFKGTGEALPFDRYLQPKPAFNGIAKAYEAQA